MLFRSSAKRKISDDDDDDAEPSASKAKKLKKTKAEDDTKAAGSGGAETELAPNGQPTNKVIPVHIEYPPKAENSIRIATWNICGLAAASKKVCCMLIDSISRL